MGSNPHPASYTVGTRGSFPGGGAAEAWVWPLASIWCLGRGVRVPVLHSPSTLSWRGALLKKARGQLCFHFPIHLNDVTLKLRENFTLFTNAAKICHFFHMPGNVILGIKWKVM